MDALRNWPDEIRTYPKYNAVVSVVRDDSGGVEPVTLAEAKLKMAITYSDRDAYITALIKECRRALEDDKLISIVETIIDAHLNNSKGGITIPYGPVITVYALEDENGTALEYDMSPGDIELLTPTMEAIFISYSAGPVESEAIKYELKELVNFVYREMGTLAEGVKKISRSESKRIWLI